MNRGASTYSIGVCSFGRAQSQRCPNKMLRPFAGTTLTDIVLEKLACFGAEAFFAGYEPEFRVKSEKHKVAFLQRDARSTLIDEPITDILSFLRAAPFEHILIVNACLPFLRIGTIRTFLEGCIVQNCQPAFAVIRRQNFFLRLTREPINFDAAMKTINTKIVEPVYEFAHALYFFKKAYFFEQGTYWDWRTVRLVEISGGRELLDIDTEEDFALAESLWFAKQDHVKMGPLV